MKPKKSTIIAWAICIPLSVLEVYGLVRAKKMETQSLVWTFVTFTLVFVIFFFLIQRRGGEKVEKDERTMRIANRAMSYSWILSIFSVTAIMYFEEIEVLHMAVMQVLTVIAMIMSFSSIIIRAILSQKGDVD
jgi:hypothetical protein